MAIIGIVAIAKNFAIGKDGKLPWHHAADLKFFKQTTTGHIVVMGANTWRSIGKPLPNRRNVVLSRSGGVEVPPEVTKLTTTDEVIKFSKQADKDVFIIGGAKTYEAFADAIDQWIVTEVPDDVPDADTFIAENTFDDFELERSIELEPGLTVKYLRRK
jgi:dihydrofolate reductase